MRILYLERFMGLVYLLWGPSAMFQHIDEREYT